jgi:FkbM family methyltransferase
MARDYDPPVAEWLSQHVKPGDLCANVGGNTGVYVLQCAHWNGPDGRVVVFEPNPRARAILTRHIRYNHLEARVQVVDAAVSDSAGTAAFYADTTGDGMSRLGMPNDELPETVAMVVRTVNLDSFFPTAPAWLLIDVEGFELKVLCGARRLIPHCKGLVVELHPASWSVAGTSEADLEALLREHALTLTPLTGQTDPLKEYGHIVLQHAS